MLKRGDLVRVGVSSYWMTSQPTAYTYGIMAQDYDSTTKLAKVALFYLDKPKTFQIRAVEKAGKEIEFKDPSIGLDETVANFFREKAEMDKDKYQIGDLLISYPLNDHIGVVIDVEKDFYKTNFGRMNRITIRCETMGHKVFHLPETAVDVDFGGEPAWRKVGE